MEVHRRAGAIQLQLDPAGAVPELQEAIREMHALNEQANESVEFKRLEAGVLGPYAGALKEIGQYRDALAVLEQGLTRESECFQDRAAGIFPEQRANRTANTVSALKVLLKEQSLLEDLSRIEPDSAAWPLKLGLVLIEEGRQQRALNRPGGSIRLAQTAFPC